MLLWLFRMVIPIREFEFHTSRLMAGGQLAGFLAVSYPVQAIEQPMDHMLDPCVSG